MKLEKFYAESMPQALSIIQKKLGQNAVIYSQESKDNFIEVIAGVPKSEQIPEAAPIKKSHAAPEISTTLDDKLLRLQKINHEALDYELQSIEKRNLLQYKLRQLKFTHSFIDKLLHLYSSSCEMAEIANDDYLIKMLLSKIQIEEDEFIDTRNICALVGPTGVGKSTTIAKLAKRFISRYGSHQLGIISTDFQRIITKNQFHYFGKLLDIQIEYAKDIVELQQAIHYLHTKKLILIDTAGVTPKDNQKIANWFDQITFNNEKIPLYLVLPSNLQSELLEELIEQFRLPNTAGCIVTKKDEAKSFAPCLSAILNQELKIAYMCEGQNIATDILPANKIDIIKDIFFE